MKLEKEFQYYLDHQIELVSKYNNKFIVIKGNELIGVYNTKQEAYDKSTQENELGTFLIQHCLPGDLGISQTFHSQAIFANLVRTHI